MLPPSTQASPGVQVRSRGRRSAWWFWIWGEIVNFAHEGLQWWRMIGDSVRLPSALWIKLIQFNVRGTEPAEGSVVTLYKCQSPTLREESGIRTHSEPSPAASSHHDAHWKNMKTAAN